MTVFTTLEYPTSIKKAFDVLFPESSDYTKAIIIAQKLKEKGKLIGAIDIMISAMSLNRSFILVTKDKDFNNIKEFFPDFKLNLV